MVFARNTQNGKLTFAEVHQDEVNGITTFANSASFKFTQIENLYALIQCSKGRGDNRFPVNVKVAVEIGTRARLPKVIDT